MHPDPRQVDLFGNAPDFDGATYDRERDYVRLSGQLSKVYGALQDGRWWTLRRLADRCGGTEASISARLRDLRKPAFGAFIVDRRHVERGLFEYRLRRGNHD